VVPGGGLSPDGQRWVSGRPDFFLPVRVLGHLFRRLFLESLQKAFDSGKLQFLAALESFRQPEVFAELVARRKACEWVVYAKRPFAGPQQVLDYLGRYTHRVAISNNRLLDMENGQVRFQWKDYRDEGKIKTMTLSADEFIRRFLLHVSPNGFQRIRYYGLLGQPLPKGKISAVPAPARHVTPIRAHQPIVGGERLPGPLRRAYRQLAAPMSAVPARPHARGCDLAAAPVSFCTSPRFVMIRILLLTRVHGLGSASAMPECCRFAANWGKYPPKPAPATCSPPNPPCPNGHPGAAVAILDRQQPPATHPSSTKPTIQNP